MKCPRCDADISTGKKCGKCGFNDADTPDELEVEYKDFKTSELLEIRHKKQTTPEAAETKISAGQSVGGVRNREKPANPTEAKKKSFPVLAVVVLVLALIIGGLFLVRLLVLQK